MISEETVKIPEAQNGSTNDLTPLQFQDVMTKWETYLLECGHSCATTSSCPTLTSTL
jgi:hypothetical protein